MLVMANMEYMMLNIITGLVSIGYCYQNWLMLLQLVIVITLHPFDQISQIFFYKISSHSFDVNIDNKILIVITIG
jgi:hypothetical protein